MRIAFQILSPGLSGQYPKSSYKFTWADKVMRELRSRGHETIWLSGGQVEGCQSYVFVKWAKPDALFVDYHWPNPERPDKHLFYTQQMLNIEQAVELGIPIFIYETDHLMADEDFELFKSLPNCTLLSPEFFPREGYKMLMFPLEHRFFKSVHALTKIEGETYDYEAKRKTGLVYVGNNYERYDMAVRYLSRTGIQTHFYGNWIEDFRQHGLTARELPEKVRRDFPTAVFHGPTTQEEALVLNASGLATVHLSKQSYAKTGLMAIRWGEAACAGTVAFIPDDFAIPDSLVTQFSLKQFRVGSAQAVARKYNELYEMGEHMYAEKLVYQCAFVKRTMSIENWMHLFENGIDGL